MKRIIALILCFFPLCANSKEECAEFSDKLNNCEVYKCKITKVISGLKEEDLPVEHEIKGIKDGECVHIQTIPGGKINCTYSEGARRLLAKNEREPSEEDMKKIDEVFKKECVFIGD